MNNVAENLERLYRGFVQQSNDWQFFLGLSGYVQQIQKAAETRPLIEKLVQQREEDHRPMAEYEALVLKETDEVAERLFAEIAKHGISDSELDKQIACYARRGKDFIWGPTLANHLFETLSKVMERLYRLGHVELVKNYVLENQHSPGELSGFTFSKSMELKEEARQVLEEKRQRAPWNSWDHLALAHFIIFESLDRSRELKSSYKDNAAAREGLNLEGCRAEMEEIRLGKVSSEETMFPKSEYLGHAARIHHYLMANIGSELLAEQSSSVPLSAPKPIVASPRYVLRKELGVWILIFDGLKANIAHEKGLLHIEYLLKNPPTEPIHAIDLDVLVHKTTRNGEGVTEIIDPHSEMLVTLDKSARPQERNLSVDEKEGDRRLWQTQKQCKAILDDPMASELAKEEARNHIDEIDRYFAKTIIRSKNNAARSYDKVRKAIDRLLERLKNFRNSDGTTNPAYQAFAEHLCNYVIGPSSRLFGKQQFLNRRFSSARKGVAQSYIYERPDGIVWSD